MAVHHRPASTALSDWGRSHRFAGSGDRSAIGSLVYDALRCRNSIAWRMGADDARSLALGASLKSFGLSLEELQAMADGSDYSIAPLTPAEAESLARPLAADAPVWIEGDFPEWLSNNLERTFAGRLAAEGAALAQRAPIDLRVNGLKAVREKVVKAFAKFGAVPTPLSPFGVRIPAPEGTKKAPNVEADAAHGKGWFEVQDEGSQIAALLAGAQPREQVLDLCAGAGGKTLALAAQMQNTGQIYAYDASRQQLRPIFERLKRAGARNVQVMEGGDAEALNALAGRFDLVFADAPCTGSGTWRRRPDAKWRLKPEALEDRKLEQRAVLEQAAQLVKPGGRLVYVTCSILAEENADQVAWFQNKNADFRSLAFGGRWGETVGGVAPTSADGGVDWILLTPLSHGTDGFFIAVLERTGG